jgi:membrane fusion protein (multidrug efflux system)
MKIRLKIINTTILAGAIFSLVFLQNANSKDENTEPQVDVSVSKIQKTTLRSYVTGYGHIEAEPAIEGRLPAGARITSSVAGIVTEVRCYEGLHVKKGAVLFLLDSRIAEAEFEKARQAMVFAEKAFQRQKELQQSDATSDKTFQEIENQLAVAKNDLAAAETNLSYYRISAPFSGTITSLKVRTGEYVDSNSVMAEIVDLSRLVAVVNIPVSETTDLRSGQSAEIRTDNGSSPVSGRLILLSPGVDAVSGSVTAYVGLPPDAGLKPGRFVSARIISNERLDCLAVPSESLVKDSEEGWIISVVTGGRSKRIKVKTGLRDNGMVEVESKELKKGMTVITLGTYALPDNTKVHVIEDVTGEK